VCAANIGGKRDLKGSIVRRRGTSRGGWNQACVTAGSFLGTRAMHPGLNVWTTSTGCSASASAMRRDSASLVARKTASPARGWRFRRRSGRSSTTRTRSCTSGERRAPWVTNSVTSAPADARPIAVSIDATFMPLGESA
jgi:hypothetical protein